MGDMKNMYELQKQANKIKKELRNIHVEAEEGGVLVTVNGELEVISIEIDDKLLDSKNKIEKNTVKALNKAIKKAQEVSASKMQEVMGNMGFDLPGM